MAACRPSEMSAVMFSTSPPESVRNDEPMLPASPRLRTLLPTTISPGESPFCARQKISLPESEQTYMLANDRRSSGNVEERFDKDLRPRLLSGGEAHQPIATSR